MTIQPLHARPLAAFALALASASGAAALVPAREWLAKSDPRLRRAAAEAERVVLRRGAAGGLRLVS